MLFLDESGDDGSKESSSTKFFVVSIINSNKKSLEEEYFYIKEKLKILKKDYKWNSLKRSQKLDFYNIVRDLDSKVSVSYVDKSKHSNFEDMYYKLAIFSFNEIRKEELVIYTGEHLGKMFDKVRRYYKKEGIKLSFRVAKGEEVYGVLMADLWAGYINYLLKNNLGIPENRNLVVKEYL